MSKTDEMQAHHERMIKKFDCQVYPTKDIDFPDAHALKITNNGFQWSELYFYSSTNLRKLHSAIGEYLEKQTPPERGLRGSDGDR